MVAQRTLMTAFLFAALALAGCTEPPQSDDPIQYKEDHGLVELWLSSPVNLDTYPIKELRGVPRLVAFIAGDNDTITRHNSTGYVDVGMGWPDDWGEGNHSEHEYPRSAIHRWDQEATLWFQAQVPAGNYSTIRIELVDVIILLDDGTRGLGVNQAGKPYGPNERLSFALPADQYFTVEPEKENAFVLQAGMERQDVRIFTLK